MSLQLLQKREYTFTPNINIIDLSIQKQFLLKNEIIINNSNIVNQYREINDIENDSVRELQILETKHALILFESGLGDLKILLLNSSYSEKITSTFYNKFNNELIVICNEHAIWNIKSCYILNINFKRQNIVWDIRISNSTQKEWPSYLQFDDINNLLFCHYSSDESTNESNDTYSKIYSLSNWKYLFTISIYSPEVKIVKGIIVSCLIKNNLLRIVLYSAKNGELLQIMDIEQINIKVEFVIPFVDKILVKLANNSLRIYSMVENTFITISSPKKAHYIIPLQHEYFISRDGYETQLWTKDGVQTLKYPHISSLSSHFISLKNECISCCFKKKEMLLKDILSGKTKAVVPINQKIIYWDYSNYNEILITLTKELTFQIYELKGIKLN